MFLSVSSFPGAHSKLTTNPTWGEGPSPTTKRWFLGGRLNTSGASLMKGIRHIGKVQLKNRVARLAPKASSQNLRPNPPPRPSVGASTVVIDIVAVPHDDGRKPSTDISHDASIPDPTSWPITQTPAPVDSTFLPIPKAAEHDFTPFATTQHPPCLSKSRRNPGKAIPPLLREDNAIAPLFADSGQRSVASRLRTPSSSGPPKHSSLVLRFPVPTTFETTSCLASPSALTWCADPLLVGNPRPRAFFAGVEGAVSGTVQPSRTRFNAEAARAARGGSTSLSPFWKLKTEEMGTVPDLPVVTFTPADGDDSDGSPSSATHESKNELLAGDSNLRRREARTTVRERTLSSPSGMHVGSRIREPPPSPLPLLSVDIARLRSGSRPTSTPLSPFLATGRLPTAAPTTRASNPVAPIAPSMPRRRLTGPRSTRVGHGNVSDGSLSRSRSQPQLRTAVTVTGATRSAASAADGQPISSRSRAGRPALAPAAHLRPSSGPAGTATSTRSFSLSIDEPPDVLRGAPPVRASSQGWKGARGERRPRTAPETGYTARPLAPVVAAMGPWAAW